MSKAPLNDIIVTALEDLKAKDVNVLDVHALTTITDTMIVASGTSDRHVRSLAESVVDACKKAGYRPFGVEGLDGEEINEREERQNLQAILRPSGSPAPVEVGEELE